MESAIFNVLVLVGDLFGAFAAQENVCTATQFIADLEAGAYHRYANPLHLVLGQGIDDATWKLLTSTLALIPPGVLTAYRDERVVPVPSELVHKTCPQNVLIGDLTRDGELSYSARLRIDPHNDLLLDHTSGQHVQGMVITEACRQLMLAAVLRDHSPARDAAFLLRSLETEFSRYLYPVGATLRLRLERVGGPRRGRAEFTAAVEVHQAGELAGRCRCTFAVLDASVQGRLENAAAATAVRQVLAGRRPVRRAAVPYIPAQPVPALALSEV